MSNDTKLWVARGVILLCLLVDLWLLGNAIAEAMKSADPNAEAHPMIWFTLFLIAMAANMPAYLFYRRVKASRWEPIQHKSQSQVEVEILAAVAKQQTEDRVKNAKQSPK